jgi:hypothetical protein
MSMKSDICPGDMAIGKSGAFEVISVEGDRVVLNHPDGNIRVPMGKILRFERPRLTVGDRVRKIHRIGWTGIVQKISGDRVEVLWHGDKHSTGEPLAEIELNDKPRFKPNFEE